MSGRLQTDSVACAMLLPLLPPRAIHISHAPMRARATTFPCDAHFRPHATVIARATHKHVLVRCTRLVYLSRRKRARSLAFLFVAALTLPAAVAAAAAAARHLPHPATRTPSTMLPKRLRASADVARVAPPCAINQSSRASVRRAQSLRFRSRAGLIARSARTKRRPDYQKQIACAASLFVYRVARAR